MIGADPNRESRPEESFRGHIDEVRLSKGARYKGASFKPERILHQDDQTVLLMHFDAFHGPFTPKTGGGFATLMAKAEGLRCP